MELGPDWAKLWRELVKVAARPLRKAFLQAGDEDETLKYPTLAREVQRLVGDERWRRSPGQATIQVIGVAIEDIPDVFNGRNPELPRQEHGYNPWKRKPEREIAEFLYGYRDKELPEEKPRTYKGGYLPKAYELLGYKPSPETLGDKRINPNIRRPLRVVREDMAAAILNLRPSDPRLSLIPRPLKSVAPIQLADTPKSVSMYVHRADMERTFFQELEAASHRVVLLHGESGTGKSELARYLAGLLSGDGSSWHLRARTSQQLADDVSLILDERGVGTDVSDAVLRRRFRALIADEEVAPAVVVIDDVNVNVEMILDLLPDPPSSVVIVTGYADFAARLRAVPIRVPDMTDAEAVEMIHMLTAKVSDGADADMLAFALGNRPLAIEQACTFLEENRGTSAREFLNSFQRGQVSIALGAIGSVERERNLRTLYSEIFSDLDQHHPEAAVLLEARAFGSILYDRGFQNSEAIELVYLMIRMDFGARDIDAVRMTRVQYLNLLQSRNLITSTTDLAGVQQLTSWLVRGLRKKQGTISKLVNISWSISYAIAEFIRETGLDSLRVTDERLAIIKEPILDIDPNFSMSEADFYLHNGPRVSETELDVIRAVIKVNLDESRKRLGAVGPGK